MLVGERCHAAGLITAEQLCAAAGKAVCVGRNYVAHAQELSNPVPESPVLFVKPSTCIVPLAAGIILPSGAVRTDENGQLHSDCHHELELVLVVGQQLSADNYRRGEAWRSMAGIAMGLDLTLRSVQSELKGKGLPWTRAKCFDGAAPVTDAVSLASTGIGDLADLSIELKINDQVRQSGQLADMIFDVEDLLAEITTFMSLMPGDLVFTGTPAGVGPLLPGECLALTLAKRGQESVAMENVLIEAYSMVR